MSKTDATPPKPAAIADAPGRAAPTSKHTPGQWRYARWDGRPHYLVEVNLPCINGLAAWFSLAHVFIPDEAEVGYTDGAHNEEAAEANARLISAAPEMFEALRNLESVTSALHILAGSCGLSVAGALVDARAALSKATGAA